MFKILLIVFIIIILCLGLFFYFYTPKEKFENPIGPVGKNLGKILGFSKNDSQTNKDKGDIFTEAKDNIENNVDNAKEIAYNKTKTTLDNVFNKQSNSQNEVTVNVLGVTNNESNKASYFIDLSRDSNLKLNLAINTKYYLNFKNIPNNYCLYINNEKYPLKEGVVEVQFTKVGNYPIKANSCDLNDKDIGILTVN